MVYLGVGFERDQSLLLEEEPSAGSLGLRPADIQDIVAEAKDRIARIPDPK
jgi:hypothetical protein